VIQRLRSRLQHPQMQCQQSARVTWRFIINHHLRRFTTKET